MSKKTFQKFIITTFFMVMMLVTVQAKAQAPSYKSWLEVGFEQKIKIKKFKFKVGVSQGFRISDVVYTPKYNALTEVGASTKITDFYKIGIAYRASYIGGFENRLSMSNTFKFGIVKDLDVSFRLKYQAEFEENNPFSQDFRLKTSFKWDAHKDYKPYLFGEILYNDTYNYSNFNEYRVGFGVDADYKKKHQFDVSLMYSQDLNVERPGRAIVLGLGYKFAK